VKPEQHPPIKQALGLFDLTSLVIGAVIGADIYVVASLGASFLGPAQLAAWVVAGVMAACIGIGFAQCAAIVPRVGGSYAYAREAFGHFPGFIVGWCLYLAEWINLAVFPIAFVRYLGFFFHDMTWWQIAVAKILFIAFLLSTNLFGTRTAGRVNDILTIGKLTPLAILIVAGIVFVALKPSEAFGMLTPFAPLGWNGFGPALILVFWAYAGFELAAIPAGEVKNPSKTLPQGFFLGLAISTLFYLLINVIVTLVVPQAALVSTQTPLADALGIIVAIAVVPIIIGGTLMALGAVVSISGADESATIGTSRLGYALAADGYFPRFFARLSPRYGTPTMSLIFQGITALIVSLVGGFTALITLSVVFLAVAYLATDLAALRLLRKNQEQRLEVPGLRILLSLGIVSSLYLFSQAGFMNLLIGVGALGIGLIVYMRFAPKVEIKEVQDHLASDEHRVWVIMRFMERSPLLFWRRFFR
jgi:basic amino acid/polyamine antiporter, APA family